MCVSMYRYIYVYSRHVCTFVCMQQKTNSYVLPQTLSMFLVFIFVVACLCEQGLNYPWTHQTGLETMNPRNLPVSIGLALALYHAFFHQFWWSNSCPCAIKISTLPIKSSSHPNLIFLRDYILGLTNSRIIPMIQPGISEKWTKRYTPSLVLEIMC